MGNVNKVILLGRLVKSPEIRQAGKTSVANFSIATSRKRGDREETCFIDCSWFGDTMLKLEQYMEKGGLVHIIGRLKQDTWKDKATGGNRSKIGVVVEDLQLVSRPDRGNGGDGRDGGRGNAGRDGRYRDSGGGREPQGAAADGHWSEDRFDSPRGGDHDRPRRY